MLLFVNTKTLFGLEVKQSFHDAAMDINPLCPTRDLSQISHCKSLSVGEVMRIENIITQVKFS